MIFKTAVRALKYTFISFFVISSLHFTHEKPLDFSSKQSSLEDTEIMDLFSIRSNIMTDGNKSDIPHNELLTKIPFKIKRNRIILPMKVENSRELDIILDTGMTIEGVYLFHKELGDEIGIDKFIKVRVGGAGSGEASYAIMSDSFNLSLSDCTISHQKVIIAQNKTTQRFPTYGVLGYNLSGMTP